MTAWNKAIGYDPYTVTMFPVKQAIEVTSDMPDELRFLGLFLVLLGGGLALLTLLGAKRGAAALLDVWIVVWIGGMIAAYGASFFVAADYAEARILQENGVEARQT
uniref:hypothetical protein n=1 Tax=uncultured Erythrobacter sp. TaxID=263913 RepID=UPI0026328FE3|nr:hypothetical protein [uncultured Erythrobacter sp.]